MHKDAKSMDHESWQISEFIFEVLAQLRTYHMTPARLSPIQFRCLFSSMESVGAGYGCTITTREQLPRTDSEAG